MKGDSSIALLSGGLDSTIAMAIANKQRAVKLAITFDYGQRASVNEISQSKKIAKHLRIPHRVVRVPYFKRLKNPGLLLQKRSQLPSPDLKELDKRRLCLRSAARVWVPNRNGLFIEIAAAIAEDLGARNLVVGFNREEASTFPDNSAQYLKAISKALSYSTANQVRVISPTQNLTKKEIVAEAISLCFPLQLVWSCYRSQRKMCGRCESCRRLKRALLSNQLNLREYF